MPMQALYKGDAADAALRCSYMNYENICEK